MAAKSCNLAEPCAPFKSNKIQAEPLARHLIIAAEPETALLLSPGSNQNEWSSLANTVSNFFGTIKIFSDFFNFLNL